MWWCGFAGGGSRRVDAQEQSLSLVGEFPWRTLAETARQSCGMQSLNRLRQSDRVDAGSLVSYICSEKIYTPPCGGLADIMRGVTRLYLESADEGLPFAVLWTKPMAIYPDLLTPRNQAHTEKSYVNSIELLSVDRYHHKKVGCFSSRVYLSVRSVLWYRLTTLTLSSLSLPLSRCSPLPALILVQVA